MGGAAGHMAHPFDLPEVNTGNDLISFFEEAAEYLATNPASVKIDGVNVSFKLIDGPRGKEFAVDRGSTKPIDIEGITLGRVGERFPEGHGMRPAITTLLNIFNRALPNIQNELQKLGMWENPTIFLNTEYVTKGRTNVQEYDKNFLAIHGVNQFYEKTNARTGAQRPGAERPLGNKAPSSEISYSDEVFNSLIEKVRPMAAESDFEIYGSVPTTSVAGADFSRTLAAPFPVNYGYDEEGKLFSDTKPLGQWLNEAENPRDIFVSLTNGKKVGALSKLIYTEILNGTPMTELLMAGEEFWNGVKQNAPPKGTDVEKAVDGAVFYHATRMLGNDILKTLTSDMGPVESHEGAVVRGVSSVPVKITGEFILGGLQTSFQENKQINEQLEQKRHLALIPGGFKPPHKGHLEMVKFYYNNVGPGGKVIILMGSGGKSPRTINGRPITLQDSMSMWETYLRNDPEIEWPSERIEFQNVEGTGPIAPIIDYVREQADPETEVIHLGAGEKDAGRWKMMMDDPKNNPRGVEIRIEPAPNLFDAQGNPLSASTMRKAVEEKDLETFKNYIPDTSLHVAEDMYVKLRGALLREEKEDRPLPLGIFLGLIEEVIDEEKQVLNEWRNPFSEFEFRLGTSNVWSDEKAGPVSRAAAQAEVERQRRAKAVGKGSMTAKDYEAMKASIDLDDIEREQTEDPDPQDIADVIQDKYINRLKSGEISAHVDPAEDPNYKPPTIIKHPYEGDTLSVEDVAGRARSQELYPELWWPQKFGGPESYAASEKAALEKKHGRSFSRPAKLRYPERYKQIENKNFDETIDVLKNHLISKYKDTTSIYAEPLIKSIQKMLNIDDPAEAVKIYENTFLPQIGAIIETTPVNIGPSAGKAEHDTAWAGLYSHSGRMRLKDPKWHPGQGITLTPGTVRDIQHGAHWRTFYHEMGHAVHNQLKRGVIRRPDLPKLGIDIAAQQGPLDLIDVEKTTSDWQRSPTEIHAEVAALRSQLGRPMTTKDVINFCKGDPLRIAPNSKLVNYINCDDPKVTARKFNSYFAALEPGTKPKSRPAVHHGPPTRFRVAGDPIIDDLAENKLSPDKFLRLIEKAINEDIVPSNRHKAGLDGPQAKVTLGRGKMNAQAAEDALWDNDDGFIDEASGMAGGNVAGASGEVGNRPPGSHDDEYLIREEEDELVEEVMDYLLYKNGAK